MTPGERWASEYRTEVNSRSDFEGRGVHWHPAIRAHQQSVIPLLDRQVEGLCQTYDADMNPLHVWHALMLLGCRARFSGEPLTLPSWIAAYLARAALQIQAGAVQWPDGDRHGPPDPEFPQWESAKGLTADQRRDLAMEALGFKAAKGANPFTKARRLAADAEMVKQAEAAKAAGNPPTEAIPYKVEHPAAKLRRARKRVSGKK